MKPPEHTIQGRTLEALWRRADEIRALCGLHPAAPTDEGSRERSIESLVEVLLSDLEANFRRELATRVQLEGLAELLAFQARDEQPGSQHQLLLRYLARALDEPGAWLGVLRGGDPPDFSLHRATVAGGVSDAAERIPLAELDPEWMRWLALGRGEAELPADPWGRHRGGPWAVVPIRGELPPDRLGGPRAPCPGASEEAGVCTLSDGPLEPLVGGAAACGSCRFRHVVGLLGTEGALDPRRRASLEAVAPSLGTLLVNLSLNEALDLEARFRREVIENLPLGVVAVDGDGTILTWNRSAESISGTPREAAQGQPIARLHGAEAWQDALVRALSHGSTEVVSERIVRRADGASIPVEVKATALRGADGTIHGAVATLTDLSSLRTMEERIRQLDRLAALGRFASSVAHEIRNPLTGIATGVQYLSREFPEGHERHADVQFVLREVTRLNSIIQDLLSATRPRMLTLGPVSVADVASRAIQSLGKSIRGGTVEIRLQDADNWPKVLADTDQLLQVLLNLFQNAVQAIPESRAAGLITVRARPVGNPPTTQVAIEISDNGVGIEPEHLAHLFEPFYTTRPKGTGLGLFVAHGIIQRHGGSIEVESKPGQGSRFRIVLPGAA
ncbi:MAG: PAS domain S-box protein [Candidatus Latescibacteria bacterium]|nr:PAS domain S-box protein [Candidatus Latescibacterota bacterium]